MLPFSLGFFGPFWFALLLPLNVPIGLLATIFAMWAHWVCYLFPRVSLTCFALLLPLNVPMGLLAVIPVMLAHWIFGGGSYLEFR